MLRIFIFMAFVSAVFGVSKELIVVERNQVIQTDYYVSGAVIEISGVCKKDVYISATQLVIDGVIEGDLICFCGSLQITGTVQGAIRGVVGQALIAGTVGKSVTLAAAGLTITPSAQFLGNLYVAAANIDCSGQFMQNVSIAASHVRYAGRLEGDGYFYAGTIRLGNKSFIGGTLYYSSPEPIDIQSGSIVQKGMIEKEVGKHFAKSKWIDKLFISSRVAGGLMNFMFTLLVGLLLLKIWPAAFQKSLYYLTHHLGRSVVQGALFVILVPLIGVILLMTILGIPIALTLIVFSIFGLYTAKIHTLYFCAEKLKAHFKKKWKAAPAFSGLVLIYFLLQMVPILGSVIAALFTLAGLGAVLHIPKVPVKR